MNERKDVLVLLESADGSLSQGASALLAEGARLAGELQGELHAILLGTPAPELAEGVGSAGAASFLRGGNGPESYDPLLLQEVLMKTVQELEPCFLLALTSSTSSDVLPRIAFHYRAPFVADCADITIGADKSVRFLQPVQGGRLFAEINSPTGVLKIATFPEDRLSVTESAEAKPAAKICDVASGVAPARNSIRNIGFQVADHRTIDITEAQVIVAVGRGLGNKEQLPVAEQLADSIGGAIGCTRPMVDAGILPYERQIGQTGKRVTPKFVLLCGISGAIEFTQGVKGNGKSIAINNDPRAPIFNSADLGIIGSCQEVLPQVLDYINKHQAKTPGQTSGSANSSAGGNQL